MNRRAVIPLLISSAVVLLGGVMPAPTVFAASHPEIYATAQNDVLPPITPSDRGQDFYRAFAITSPTDPSLFTASYNGQSSEFSMNIDLAATTGFVNTAGITANDFPTDLRLFIATYDGSTGQLGPYNQIVYNPSLVAGQTYETLTRACTKVVLKNNNQPVPIYMRIHLTGNERAGTYRVTIFGQGEFSELPTVPSNLSASVLVGPLRVSLSWTASSVPKGSTLTGYKIYRNGGSAPLAMVAAPGTTYTDSSVAPGMTYTYAVSAYNAAGDTEQCTPVSVTTP